jgi:hypothetical protein
MKDPQPSWMINAYLGLVFGSGFSLYGSVFYPENVPWWVPAISICLLIVVYRRLKFLRDREFAQSPWDEEEVSKEAKRISWRYFRIMMIVMLAIILCTWMVMQILVKNLR